ncbi:MAG: four-carbon acid sugar kinase family protein [Granulosicoccus sp.]
MNESTKPVLSYYGDDFTGSTDVMEAMASNGFNCVLFLEVPDEQLLERFADSQVIGIAGTSRSETPEWMNTHLTDVFKWLKKLNADFCHYKVCSTFDSCPTIGNIGRATEIGKDVFEQAFVPLLVGAPQLKRYTAFGHLFAAYQGQHYRIDRHPVMSRHPVTPMHESDLLVHLSEQSKLESDLVDLVHLNTSNQQAIDSITAQAKGIVLFDVDNEATQSKAGQQIDYLRDQLSFVVGSSGVEYALLAHWKNTGQIKQASAIPTVSGVKQIAVVSGSVSPTTERQIKHAIEHGFESIPVDPMSLVGASASSTIDSIVHTAIAALRKGLSPLIHTALGPAQDKGQELDPHPGARHQIGQALGIILRNLIENHDLQRVVIAGGDTSSHALPELSIEALTLLMPIPTTPGSPLCICHGSNQASDGLEIALKGGQVGGDDYFSMIRNPA